MGISLHFSNKLDTLLVQLSDDLQTANSSVFSPDLIVTQTEGMQQWVSMELARKRGIFANFRYVKPNDIVLEVAQMAKVTDHFQMSADKVRWLLYFLLNEEEFINQFDAVSQYYKNAENAEVKRMQLASKIADLFDQMVIYRPEYIQAWNAKTIIDKDDPIEAWQAYLCQKMRAKFKDPLDRTELKDKLIQHLKSDKDFQELLSKRLPVISVFGLSVLTNYHVEFFYELAQYVEVRFYFLNPAPEEYWYDCKTTKEILRLKYLNKRIDADSFSIGNDLLISWGKIGQHLFSTLLDLDEFANGLTISSTEIPEPNTLLELVQSEIFHNTTPDNRQAINSQLLNDQSIKIESCHSESREVEVLYNFLIKTLSENSDLALHDLLVMVPNIEKYSPFIQSIFDNAPYRLPYSLADRELQQSEELIAVLFALLELTNYEFTSEKILQLLDYKIVTDKYKISDTQLIRRVVKDTNIRFGWDNPADETETNLVSWQSGIERIVMGIAMKGGEMYDYQGSKTLCYDALEGADAFELLRFVAFLKAIQHTVQEGNKARTLIEWRNYIQLMGENLLNDNSPNEGLEMVMKRLDYLVDLVELNDAIIPRAVFVQSIESILNASANNGGFLRGNITFCSTLPMRSIPFKVVALMGMNSRDFPRQDVPLGFDLMARKPKRGDRSSKLNDKYLFLEALLSAEKCFYLSYLGRSSKDNSHKEPSILIEELLNYLQQQSDEKVKETIVTEHPLHSFSSHYNHSENPKLITYFNYNSGSKSVSLIENSNQKKEENNSTTCRIEQLIKAVSEPIKFYFNHTLSIYYSDDNLLVPESEKFELNNLDEWIYKNHLLKNEITDSYILEKKQKGELPLANMGIVNLAKTEEQVAPYRELYNNLINGFTENTLSGSVQLENNVFDYQFPIFLADNQVRQIEVCFSSNLLKYALRAWIKHLVLLANGIDVKTYLIFNDKKSGLKTYETNLSNKTEASSILKNLEIFYEEASQKVKPIAHKEFYEVWSKKKEEDSTAILEKLRNKIYDQGFGPMQHDAYLQALYNLDGIESELNDSLLASLDAIYQPLEEYFLSPKG